jgi:hypothetical protein
VVDGSIDGTSAQTFGKQKEKHIRAVRRRLGKLDGMHSMPALSSLHRQIAATQQELEISRVFPAWEASEGAARPLGITWIVPEQAWNMAVYARHAASVSLILFDDD